ncbi:MAG: tRNA lysidine(34) synthetase TilS [Gammaproteobacteria bacterium]|nr:tRNA lysidine(34) synthetase TilS [Gammaproteobacteria bacterium]
MLVMRGLPAARCYWVAYSGGLDSTALLLALSQQREALSGRLCAVHVNHHINPAADSWQLHCQRVCDALHIPLDCKSVKVVAVKGHSLEAIARQQRYKAFREIVNEDDILLLAHHLNDQMETFLLQALRGAGPRGLAAMPVIAAFNAGKVARPLLSFTRAEIKAWADLEKVSWLEDPSNSDTRFDRNYLRTHVIPEMLQRWPSAPATISRSAAHCSETLELLAELANQDLASSRAGQGPGLAVAAVRELSPIRAKNLLRHWLAHQQLPLPPSHKLEQILREVLLARAPRNPCVAWAGAEVRRYRGCLYALQPLPPVPSGELNLRQEQPVNLGAGLGSILLVSSSEGQRLRADIPQQGFQLRFRVGGEICKPAGRAHHRPLKKWLQEFKVVPWMRGRIPLIYDSDRLVAVAGLFVCAPYAAVNDEPGFRIHWEPHPLLM